MQRIVVAVAAAGALVGLSPAARAQPSSARSSIEAQNQKFSATFQKGDAAAVAALYSPDGETFPPNADVVSGRDAIQKMWQSVIDSGVASVKLTTRDAESAGDWAWESGTYELAGKDGASIDRGKYVVVWKRLQGEWHLHRDIWNSSLPAKP
jgi:uncharacterized protein (TIGR02246 family)